MVYPRAYRAFSCRRVTFADESGIAIQMHLNSNTFSIGNGRPLICKICECVERGNFNLFRHLQRNHLPWPLSKYICLRCDCGFHSPDVYQEHLQSAGHQDKVCSINSREDIMQLRVDLIRDLSLTDYQRERLQSMEVVMFEGNQREFMYDGPRHRLWTNWKTTTTQTPNLRASPMTRWNG